MIPIVSRFKSSNLVIGREKAVTGNFYPDLPLTTLSLAFMKIVEFEMIETGQGYIFALVVSFLAMEHGFISGPLLVLWKCLTYTNYL